MLSPGSEPQLPGSHTIIIVNNTYSTLCMCMLSPSGALLITLSTSYMVLCFVLFCFMGGRRNSLLSQEAFILFVFVNKETNQGVLMSFLFSCIIILFYASEFYPHVCLCTVWVQSQWRLGVRSFTTGGVDGCELPSWRWTWTWGLWKSR